MNKHIVYNVTSGVIDRVIGGNYISSDDIPEGCWFMPGDCVIGETIVDTSNPDPNHHTLKTLPSPQREISRSEITYVRDRLDAAPIVCVQLGSDIALDVTPLSFERMRDALEYWEEATGGSNTKIKWTLADNSEIFLSHSQLNLLYQEAKHKVVIRRAHLFAHASTLHGRLATVTDADMDVSKWPQ